LIDGVVRVQALQRREKVSLRGISRSAMLEGSHPHAQRLPRLGADIDRARWVVTNEDHR
jgi:hypothetical protein